MKNIKYYSTLLPLILLALASCTRNINVNVNNAVGELVIEANLTNVRGLQFVKLSRNVALSNTNTYPPVSGATVTISDPKGHNYAFTEGPAGTYSANKIAGFAGVTYTLTVALNGQTYTAKSTMPALVPLDSISAENLFIKNGNQKQITVYYQDPAAVANQYRFVEYVNSTEVDDIFVFNDMLTNGKYVNDILSETDVDINPGDTITVEMQCIDAAMYTYWLTLEEEQGNNPGGQSAAPSNPPTNITPATLGYFSAHTTESATLIVGQ